MGRYVVESRIGAGGMAEVFRARQHGAAGFARAVALKRMAPALSHDDRFSDLFIAEARTAALLSHPNLVSVLDFDRDEDGALFLVMELVDGADLSRLAAAARAAGRSISPRLAAFVCGEVLRGLGYAHALVHEGRPLGLVHRDVSPHNVLISRAGSVKIADFGIAKATAASAAHTTGGIKGKVAYMAPEQARGEPLDGRTDLYAVGVVLYELLAGERPIDGASEAEILVRLLRAQVPDLAERAPQVPDDLRAVVRRLMAHDPADRYPTAAEALEALRGCAFYPADGTTELAGFVAEVLPPPGQVGSGPQLAAPFVVAGSSPRGAGGRPIPPTAAATRYRPSRRTLAALAGLAVVAVAAAVIVWTVPPGREQGRGAPPAPTEPALAAAIPAAHAEPPAVEPPSIPEPVEPAVVVPDPPVEAPARPRRGRAERAPREAPPAEELPAAADPEPAGPPGTLIVRVHPWANVEVNGESLGLTPIRRRLPPGRYRVVLRNEELGRRETVTIDLPSRRESTLERDWR